MTIATLSSNYQISMPEELRKSMHLQPVQEFELIPMGSSIQMVPKNTIGKLRSAIHIVADTRKDMKKLLTQG
jgi:bifunctional DNA-binding transcriptional regulator/antitoxin component of YhaV-PrlF toxin-antitoxin module